MKKIKKIKTLFCSILPLAVVASTAAVFGVNLSAANYSITNNNLQNNIQTKKHINDQNDIQNNQTSLISLSHKNGNVDLTNWNIIDLEKTIQLMKTDPSHTFDDVDPNHAAIIQNPLFRTIRNLGLENFVNLYNSLLTNYRSSRSSINNSNWIFEEPNNHRLLDSVFGIVENWENTTWKLFKSKNDPYVVYLTFSNSNNSPEDNQEENRNYITLNFSNSTSDNSLAVSTWTHGDQAINGFWNENRKLLEGTTSLNSVLNYVGSSINSVWSSSVFSIANLLFGDMQKIFPWSEKTETKDGKEVFSTFKWFNGLINLSDRRSPNVNLISSFAETLNNYKTAAEDSTTIWKFEILNEDGKDVWRNGDLLKEYSDWFNLTKIFTLEQNKYSFRLTAICSSKFNESAFITYLTQFPNTFVEPEFSNVFDWAKFLTPEEAQSLNSKGVPTNNIAFNNIPTFYQIDIDKRLTYDDLAKKLSPNGDFANLNLAMIKEYLNPPRPAITNFNNASTNELFEAPNPPQEPQPQPQPLPFQSQKEISFLDNQKEQSIINFGNNLGIDKTAFPPKLDTFAVVELLTSVLDKKIEQINNFKKTILDIVKTNITLFTDRTNLTDDELIEIINGGSWEHNLNFWGNKKGLNISDIIAQSTFSNNVYNRENTLKFPLSIGFVVLTETEKQQWIKDSTPKLPSDKSWYSFASTNIRKKINQFIPQNLLNKFEKPIVNFSPWNNNAETFTFTIIGSEDNQITYNFSIKGDLNSYDCSRQINKQELETGKISRTQLMSFAPISQGFLDNLRTSTTLKEMVTKFSHTQMKELIITNEQKSIILDGFKLLTGIDLNFLSQISFDDVAIEKFSSIKPAFNEPINTIKTVNLGWYWNINKNKIDSYDLVFENESLGEYEKSSQLASSRALVLLLNIINVLLSPQPTSFDSFPLPLSFSINDSWFVKQTNSASFNINYQLNFAGENKISWKGLESVGSPIFIDALNNFKQSSKWLNLEAAQLGKAVVVKNYIFIPLFDNQKYSPSPLGIYSQKWLVFANVGGSHPLAETSLYDFLLAASGKLEKGLSQTTTIILIVVASLVGVGVLGGLFFWYMISIHRTKTKKIKEKDLIKVDSI